jgi:hypothetical protein
MTDTAPKYRLRFTNKYGETYWFVELGHRWDADPLWNRGPDPLNRRLIRRTSSKREDGAVFDALPDALAVLVTAGDPPDWVTETLDGRTVE